MVDREVGELWKSCPPSKCGHYTFQKLILKLIKERAMRMYSQSDGSYGYIYACEDFNIPYPEYLAARKVKHG